MASHRLYIEDVAFGGRGVGRLPDGRAAFVPFVIEGETVSVEVVRARRSYVEARLLSVDEPSPHRVMAPCPYFGRCGGCSYQHVAADEQLRVKTRQVEQAIRRIGRCASVDVAPMVASPKVYEYRNRITVHTGPEGIGFFGQGGREIVDVEGCLIAEAGVNAALVRLRSERPLPSGHRTLRAKPGRRGFRQTNDGAAAALLRMVSELAGAGGTRLIDAYCGAGFFLKHLRTRFEQVVGLEWDRWAVAEAEQDLAPNERYVCGDVAHHLAHVLAGGRVEDTLLLCDPPAEGLSEEVRRVLQGSPVSAIIYVSCNPTTLARDIAAFKTVYELVSVQPLDMFPQTAEIEVIANLRAVG